MNFCAATAEAQTAHRMNVPIPFVKAKKTIEDPASRIFRLLDEQEDRIGRIFLTAISSLKENIDLDELADLLANGRINDALRTLQSAADELAAASNVAFVTAGQSAAEFLTNADLGRVVYNQVNIRAVSAMQRNSLELVREFTSGQRKATSRAVIEGIESGSNPIRAARNFRDSIGLTEKQWGHVSNYRKVLEKVGTDAAAKTNALNRALRDGRSDKSIRAAFKAGRQLPPGQIDTMVARYTDGYFNHRAKVIARTEALRAVHQGNEEAYDQAIEQEVIRPGQLERTWRTATDGRERETHAALNGITIKHGEVWTTPNGSLRYPGDPDAPAKETIMCRCAILTRISRN